MPDLGDPDQSERAVRVEVYEARLEELGGWRAAAAAGEVLVGGSWPGAPERRAFAIVEGGVV